jgi:tripartite-type tricarboxylate transporter receptor subunit TctC
MTHRLDGLSRRKFLQGTIAAAGVGAAWAFPLREASAAFPDRNMKVVIPTGQGGGADRLARTFSDVWKKYLGANFEYEFFAGAAGQVGYEIYVGRKERDAYNLLFGNIGAEMIMYALQDPKYRFPQDYVYFCGLDIDDSCVFVRKESPFRTIEEVVSEAKKRPLTTAGSRLPHPASIGVLALGDATGAKFNIVPYGGGNPTMIAVLNGEADIGILPMANPISLGDRVRILTVFNSKNSLAEKSGNAPPVNKVFNTKIPDLYSARAWAIHTEAITKYPDRYQKLVDTAQKVFADPEYKILYEKTGAPFESIEYQDRDSCTKYALAMVDLAKKYKPILTAKKQ